MDPNLLSARADQRRIADAFQLIAAFQRLAIAPRWPGLTDLLPAPRHPGRRSRKADCVRQCRNHLDLKAAPRPTQTVITSHQERGGHPHVKFDQ